MSWSLYLDKKRKENSFESEIVQYVDEKNNELIYRIIRSDWRTWKEVTQTERNREVVKFLEGEGYDVQEIDEGHYEI